MQQPLDVVELELRAEVLAEAAAQLLKNAARTLNVDFARHLYRGIIDEEGRDEFAEIEDKIKKTKLSKEAREKATHELKKLRQISPMSPEGAVVRNYLDWLLSIPWNKKSKINNDLVHAQIRSKCGLPAMSPKVR